MPKVKMHEVDEEGKRQEAMVLDISEADVKQLKIGQKIEVMIEGSVGMLSVPPDGVSKDMPPELGLRVSSKKVKGLNEFADLAEDEGED